MWVDNDFVFVFRWSSFLLYKIWLIFRKGFLEFFQLLKITHYFFAVRIVFNFKPVSVDTWHQVRNQKGISKSQFISKTIFSILSWFLQNFLNSSSSSFNPFKSKFHAVDSCLSNSLQHSFALEWMNGRVNDLTKSSYFCSFDWIFR